MNRSKYLVFLTALLAATTLVAQVAEVTKPQTKEPPRDAGRRAYDPHQPRLGQLDYKLTFTQRENKATMPYVDIRVGYATDGKSIFRGQTKSARSAPLPIENLWTEGQFKEFAPKEMNTWPAGMFFNKVDNNLYWFAHNEDRYIGGTHFRAFVDLYRSADGFQTVKSLGNILRTAAPNTLGGTDYHGDLFPQGPGDMTMFADDPGGYLYCFYVDMKGGRINQGTFWSNPNQYSFRVARCAFGDLQDPSKWTKWHGGSFSESGLDGKETDLFSYPYSGGKQPLIVFSKPLGKYIAFFNGFTAWCTDLEKQDWSPIFQFNSNHLFIYHSCLSWFDKETNDQFRVGEKGLGVTVGCLLYDLELKKTEPYPAAIVENVYPSEELNEPVRPYDPSAEGWTNYSKPLIVKNIATMKGFKLNGMNELRNYGFNGGNPTLYHPKDAGMPGASIEGSVAVATPGAYRVFTSGFTGTRMGVWRLSLNGKTQGLDMDLCEQPEKTWGMQAKLDLRYRRHDQGYVEIEAPREILATWEHRGKSILATGHAGQFDRLILEEVNDNFTDGKPGPQWQWSGKPGSSTDRGLKPGVLLLAGAPAVLLQTPRKGVFPWGEWDIVTRVEFDPKEAGQAAGLMVQGTDGRCLTLARTTKPGMGPAYTVALHAKGGKEEVCIPVATAGPYLRISKRGGTYTCSWSGDARHWTTGKVFERPALGTSFPRVGLFCEGVAARFDWFDITRIGSISHGDPLERLAPRKYQVEHISEKNLAVSPGCRVSRTPDDRATAGYYDVIESDTAGGFAEYAITLKAQNGVKGPCAESRTFQGPGRYRVEIGHVTGPDRGAARLEVDGRAFAELDFTGSATAYDEADAGEILFAEEGLKKFRFIPVAGPDGKLKPIAIDYIELVPVNPALVFEDKASKDSALSVAADKPLALKFDLAVLPSQTAIAEAFLNLTLARDLPGGGVFAAAAPNDVESMYVVRFAVAGKAGDTIAVEVTELARAWVSGMLPNDGILVRPDPSSAGMASAVFSGESAARPRLELRYSLRLEAEAAKLAGGAKISNYSGKGGPPVKADKTVPDWALEVQKQGTLLYGGSSVVLGVPGASLEFANLPGGSSIRLRYHVEKDSSLVFSINGKSGVPVKIPSVGSKELGSDLNMALFDQVLQIPRGGSLQIALPEGAAPITIDSVQIAGAPPIAISTTGTGE